MREPALYRITWYKWITNASGQKVAGPRHELPKLYRKKKADAICKKITTEGILSYPDQTHVAYRGSAVSGSDFTRPHMRSPRPGQFSAIAKRLYESFQEWKTCEIREKELVYGLVYAARAVYAVENGWRNVPAITHRQRKERLPNDQYILKYLTVWHIYSKCLVNHTQSLQRVIGRTWKQVQVLYNDYLYKVGNHEQDYRPDSIIPEDYYS